MNKKDVIIILGGGINNDGFLPMIPKLRVEKGVELFKSELAPRIIMSGSHSVHLFKKLPNSEAEAMKEYATSLGVEGDKILVETISEDTVANAKLVKSNFLEPNNWKDIIVVTSDYHVERARFIFERILGREYKIDFVAAKSGLSNEEFKKKVIHEKRQLMLLRILFIF